MISRDIFKANDIRGVTEGAEPEWDESGAYALGGAFVEVFGLAGGRVGLLIRWHHVLADGLAALTLLAPLFDPEPGGAPRAPDAPDRPGTGGPPPRPARSTARAWTARCGCSCSAT